MTTPQPNRNGPRFSRAELLTKVAESPRACLEHRREDWLGLFAAGAHICDPVGSPPATKADGVLGRFWDTFIGPHEVNMEILADYVIGQDVMRDAVIHTRIGESLRIDVPAYLLYELDGSAGALEVTRMTAHWNLATLSLQAMKMGPAAWVQMTKLFTRMIALMGGEWVGGYLASLWNGVGRRGVRAAERLAAALARPDGDERRDALLDVFAEGATVSLGDETVAATALATLLPAGSTLAIEQPVAAGWTTSFRFRLAGPRAAAGIALLEFSPGSARITRARFFV